MREIADVCTKNARNRDKDNQVAIPTLDSMEEALDVIETESRLKRTESVLDALSNVSNDVFDYHTLTTHTINNNLTLVKFDEMCNPFQKKKYCLLSFCFVLFCFVCDRRSRKIC